MSQKQSGQDGEMGFIENKVAAEMAQWQGFQAAEINSEKIAEALTRPPKPDMGDLAFATFRFAKDAGVKPNELAAKLAHGAETGGLIDAVTAAGPYLNLTLNRTAIASNVLTEIETQSAGAEARDWRYGDGTSGRGNTLVIDLSSPNIAKPLAVHHLRSTMIGYSIKQLRESQGWQVVGINHLGDWGTGFGKLIAGVKQYFPEIAERAKTEESPLGDMTVQELNETYARFNREAKDNEAIAEAGKDEFAILERYIEALLVKPDEPNELDVAAKESGIVNFRIWQHAREISLAEFERMYAHLGLSFKLWPVVDTEHATVLTKEPASFYREHCIYVGESYYVTAEDLCRRLINDALENRVAEEDEGALVIFTHGKDKPPLILVKSDGATSYHARDMAAALYRKRHWKLDEMTYVVGGEQKLHFDQLFKALKALDHDWADHCSHTDFGLMLFQQSDGKWAKTSTRKGTAIMLEHLLDEAVQAVRDIIREKNPELAGSPDMEQVAHAVGVGAVVFNDLKNGRRNNVKFDWDAVLDFEGESGPYMLYQFVRMGSVTEKYREKYGEPVFEQGDADRLGLDEEWKIIQQLAAFPDAVAKASADFEPSIVARHLVELAGLTSSWWTATKDTRIVGDDEGLSLSRVRLVNAIRKVLGRGLSLLGMSLVERM
ncbi:MAG: arginine--tRNA ligase [Planctomycetes bacterium]|nr:arginine--tRNA ligase [Planctomycetota bacterium]